MPLRGPAGDVIGVLGVYEDITAQKRADERSKLDEARANTLVFIGRNLDRPALTEAFKACLA